ncbi:MAG: 4-diphosphocytidyl-2-C-methyl-D-erythritol kinase [Solirubrobacteraceae bacterium]|nr:4-diphosphocytidyl-2-C-methyl-D-erythritol kinase [Solirubrobacteraceae bacterium]
MRLVALAPGKVNLCLYVGAPRGDGYHPLVSVFQAVTLADELTLTPSQGDADEVVCAGVEGPNLAGAALDAYRQASGWDGPPVRLTIVKRVPIAAGMGGGSGDAAAALRLAAHAAGRPGDPLIDELAPRLGADVPSQIRPGRALVTGIGEQVTDLAPGPPEAFVIVPSPAALSTPAVYREADRLRSVRADLTAARAEVEAALAAGAGLPAVNDLQPAALSLCPSIEQALRDVAAAGATSALVSGSGPTVFGTFDDPERAVATAAALPGAVALRPATAADAAVRELA